MQFVNLCPGKGGFYEFFHVGQTQAAVSPAGTAVLKVGVAEEFVPFSVLYFFVAEEEDIFGGDGQQAEVGGAHSVGTS